MSFSTEPLIVAKQARDKIVDPRDKKTAPKDETYYQWWKAQDDETLCAQLLSTTAFLTKFHSARIRQASLYTRLFSGKPLYNYLASTSTLDNSQQMPMGRPTANVVYSCLDSVTSKLTQDKPRPVFLTDGGNYKEQRLSKEFNQFILGEFYRTEAYTKGVCIFRDSGLFGDGFIKVVKKDRKVELERTIATELLVDFNDAYYGKPRMLIHKKLCDRGVLIDLMPKASEQIMKAQGGTVDSSPQSTDTISDQIIVSEGWHLPSGEGSKDGRHTIVCSEGVLLDEDWKHQYFPFEQLQYNANPVGFFAQGMAEILFPTQMEIYKMLIIASQAIEMTGVPKIIISELSKVMETAFNNNISSIIKVKTMAEKPEFANPTSNNQEIYDYIKWLIENAYQMSGVSSLMAAGTKPAGLNSGEAQREFMNIQSDRFAALQRRYQDFYPRLAYKMIDAAAEIAEEFGEYTSVYPGKDGTRVVELPKVGKLKDTYIIQCFDESSLPKDPVGRQAALSEKLAAGEITFQEFRRLSNFPDLEQADQLAVALEERLLHDLDQIIEEGEKGYNPPDAFCLDPSNMGETLAIQTYNKYVVTNIEEEKLQLLRDYHQALITLRAQATPPPMPAPAAPAQPNVPVQPPNASIGPMSGAQV
jgi:hypothetical protein